MIIVHHLNNSRSQRLIPLAGTTERLRYTYRIHACDAYQRALKRGGPYSF
jgi:hypothetical protein